MLSFSACAENLQVTAFNNSSEFVPTFQVQKQHDHLMRGLHRNNKFHDKNASFVRILIDF
jgi:hypothetical protein